METHVPTTPFGRRPVSLDQIAAQLQVRRAVEEAGRPGSNHPAAVNKWKLFRTLTEARGRLGISDRALSVLNALLTFHPETALSLPQPRDAAGEGEADPSCDLVVFPSNKALALRAHGMAPSTLWRHLSALVDAGLLQRRDSPNGKRYARKAGDESSERFSHAFGFDLTPLVARAPEFEALAEAVRRDARARLLLKEKITLLRRDAGKLLALGLDENLPGPWDDHRRRFMALMTPLRRIGEDEALREIAEELAALRDAITLTLDKALESRTNMLEMKSNAPQSEEHQSNSNTQTDIDLEPASKEEGSAPRIESTEAPQESYPLGFVMEACPDVNEYAAEGRVRSWPHFREAVQAIRPMLGISPDAFADARAVLGEAQAHIVVATILQRCEYSSEAVAASGAGGMLVNGSPAIRSPGGYLRALTEKARAGQFALGPILMATIGQRLKARRGGDPALTGSRAAAKARP